jgi:CRISPR-associated exonuclease Cas4
MNWFPVLLIVIALIILWLTQRGRKRMGLPQGRVVSTDMGQWQVNNQVLYDPQLKLAGKPDYLVQQRNRIIPVEVKTGYTPAQPYDSHIFQLAAYCHLVGVTTGKAPPYGFLHYPEKTFEINFDHNLQQALYATLDSMRQDLHSGQSVPRSHQHPKRCVHCGYRDICDQCLC